MTLDHAALLKIMESQAPRSVATEGTTNPGDALAWALHVVNQAPTKRKVIVFLTDGESNVPEKLKPRQAAQLAANLGVPIYAIDASPEPKNKEEAEEVEAEARHDAGSRLAKMTDGTLLPRWDGAGPSAARMKVSTGWAAASPSRAFSIARFHEGFHWFRWLAL